MTAHDASFRSGTDALLLAAYVRRHAPKTTRFAELGCGEALAMRVLAKALQKGHGKEVTALGIDVQEQALVRAIQLCQEEGMQDMLHFAQVDLAQKKILATLCAEHSFTGLACVMANPPYYKKGRVSKNASRALALHQDALQQEQAGVADIFCGAAKRLLRHHGWFFSIYAAEHMLDMSFALQKHGFGLRSMLAVHSRPEKKARWVLLAAQKDAAHDVSVEPSLCLYARKKGENLSHAAISFCPWMQ